MKNDGLVCVYGVRYAVTPYGDVGKFEALYDPRLETAKRLGLVSHFGQPVPGEPYVLLIGTEIGTFGPSADQRREVGDAEIHRMMVDTRKKLRTAGFVDEPSLQLQWVRP